MRKPEPGAILDLRPEALFLAGHAPGAVNIPLEELPHRVHELPPKGSPVNVFDGDPARLKAAAEALRLRRYEVRAPSLAAADLRETGPSRAVLWQPNVFLAEALEAVAAATPGGAPPGRALDVACGAGRDAVYLTTRGYEVDAIDVLPDALERVRDLARRSGVGVKTVQQNLRRHPVLPAAAYGLVVVVRFLYRPLLPVLAQSVAPGGFIVYEAFHWQDPTRRGRALRPGHTVADGELARAFAGFEPLIARDGFAREGRLFSQLLARKPRYSHIG